MVYAVLLSGSCRFIWSNMARNGGLGFNDVATLGTVFMIAFAAIVGAFAVYGILNTMGTHKSRR